MSNKILGLSTHNLEEVLEANQFNELSYIGLGAYRSTTTKDNVTIGGKELLEIAKESTKKVALIGGVRLDDCFREAPQITYRVIGSDLMREFETRRKS